MVQVDVFWSYGIGSSFALGAWRQLRRLRAHKEGDKWKLAWEESADLAAAARKALRRMKREGLISGEDSSRLKRLLDRLEKEYGPGIRNEYFLKNLLFLSLLFVPSGTVLLWSNPSWETMQVGRYETIPQWLVGIFTTTNITQGLLGFLVTYHYLMKGNYFRAAMQTVWAYLGFFFILANGWDNRGYQRFFSRDRESFENWSWGNVGDWLRSDVVKILLAYSVAFLPIMYWWITRWLVEGYYQEKGGAEEATMIRDAILTFILINIVVFGFCLGSAILATVLIRKLGWVKGLAALAPVVAMGTTRRLWLGPTLLKRIMRVEELDGEPILESCEIAQNKMRESVLA